MILIDTSVWIDHFRRSNRQLAQLLTDGRVASHPFVIGELACGNLRRRAEILGLLDALPKVITADHDEVVHVLDTHKLAGKGLGWVDAHLLTATLLSQCTLWTFDKSLNAVARRLTVDFQQAAS